MNRVVTLKKPSLLEFISTAPLNDLHNVIFGSLFIPIVKLICFLVLFVLTYSIFKFRSVMRPVVFGFFLVYMLEVLSVIFPGAVLMSEIFYFHVLLSFR